MIACGSRRNDGQSALKHTQAFSFTSFPENNREGPPNQIGMLAIGPLISGPVWMGLNADLAAQGDAGGGRHYMACVALPDSGLDPPLLRGTATNSRFPHVLRAQP